MKVDTSKPPMHAVGMKYEPEPGYHVAYAGDTWHSTYGQEAESIRLWASDGILIMSADYVPVPGEPNTRGTYRLSDSDLSPHLTEEFRAGWRTWQAALEAFAETIPYSGDRADIIEAINAG